LHQFGFTFGNSFNRTGAFSVHGTDVRHNPDLRAGDFAQKFDFSRDVEAHFQHRDLVLLRELEQGKRQANFVVQVARIFKRHQALGEHVGGQFFCGGLADAACDANDLDIELVAPVGCQLLQGKQGIVGQQAERRALRELGFRGAQVDDRVSALDPMIKDCQAGAFGKSIVHVEVPIRTFPAQREEKTAFTHCTRVDKSLRELEIKLPDTMPEQGFKYMLKAQHLICPPPKLANGSGQAECPSEPPGFAQL